MSDTHIHLMNPSFVQLTRQNRSLILTTSKLNDPQLQAKLSYPHLRSPYEVLMHALPQLFPDEARWWSRGQAQVTDTITPAMWGLMKVAGKRLSSKIFSPETSQLIEVEVSCLKRWAVSLTTLRLPSIVGSRFSNLESAAVQLAKWVNDENEYLVSIGTGELKQEGRRWAGTRRVVGALVLNELGVVIGASLNQPQLSFTAHAEWCLLDQLWRHHLWPKESKEGYLTLISTLKPCKLCAGAWVTHAPYASLKVYYLRDDPGANGQNTAFDEASFAQDEARYWRSDWGFLSQERLSLDISF